MSQKGVVGGVGKNKDSIKSRLKTFFGKPRESLGGGQRDGSGGVKGHFVNEKLLREISCESDLSSRLKSLERLEGICQSHFLEDWAIESIWACIQDLCGLDQLAEVRQVVLTFLLHLCQNQAVNLGMNRAIFFAHFSQRQNRTAADFPFNTELLRCLSSDGKETGDLGGGSVVVPFLLQLNAESLDCGETKDLLNFSSLLRNFIKFNAAHFHEELIEVIVNQICIFACSPRAKPTEVEAIMQLIETIQTYSYLPPHSLLVVVSTLCKLVNVQPVCEVCWKLMKNLLNSHSGHRAVHMMSNILESYQMYHNDASPLRGAVFFLGMSLWGSQKVSFLKHSPTAILSSMCVAIDSNSPMVAYEVGLSVHRLVVKYGVDLQLVTWDLVVEVIGKLLEFLERNKMWSGGDSLNCPLPATVNETLTVMERYYEANSFNGSSERLFYLVEMSFHHRPECSILRLLSYRALNINPFQPGWIDTLSHTLNTFYRNDARPSVRIKAINLLRNIYTENKFLYADELVESVIVPLFQGDLEMEGDREVQSASINLLVDVAKENNSESFFHLISILGGIINAKLECPAAVPSIPSEELADLFTNVEAVVCGLVEILQSKWTRSGVEQTELVFELLQNHLHLEYSALDQLVDPTIGGQVREAIFAFILRMKASVNGRLAIIGPKGTLDYSPFLTAVSVAVNSDDEETSAETVTESVKILQLKFGHCMDAMSTCLLKELNWPTLKSLLHQLPQFLHSRLVILQDGEDPIRRLCTSALLMLADANRPGRMVGTGGDKVEWSELAELSYPLLASLISYSDAFPLGLQQKLMIAIQRGLVSHNSTVCVLASINGVLDLPHVMGPMMRDLIGRMAEIKPSPKFAIPLLELLSTVMRRRSLFEHFEENDFVTVFDLILPYTNAFKFVHFIVSMGYHIAFRWFLHCPIPIRLAAARKILRCLGEPLSESRDRNMDQLHVEGKTACVEFLSHYLFTDTPAVSHRTVAPPLTFNAKTSHTWLIDNRLVTISLSGSKTTSAGLCDNCTVLLSSSVESRQLRTRFTSGATVDSTDESCQLQSIDIRKRHRSELQSRVTRKPFAPVTSLDDSCRPLHPPTPLAIEPESSDGQMIEENLRQMANCGCWCRGWANIRVRHAFGDSSWFISLSGLNSCGGVDGQLGFSADALNTVKIIGDLLIPPTQQFKSSTDRICRLPEILSADSLAAISSTTAADQNFSAADVSDSSVSRNSSETDMETSHGGADLHFDMQSAQMGEPSVRKSSDSLPKRNSTGGTLKVTTTSDSTSTTSPSVSGSETPFVSPTTSTSTTRCPSTTRSSAALSGSLEVQKEEGDNGVDPSFILLQLLFQSTLTNRVGSVVKLPQTENFDRTLKILDRVSPYETHKIGVVYVGKGQTTEAEILCNQYGSTRYQSFIERLGSPVVLKGVDPTEVFLGGLETETGRDGVFTYYWRDQITQVVFHVATLMPTTEADPNCRQKKLHIGNDYVCIIYNDSQTDFDLGTIRGQFSYVAIVVTPVDQSHYLLSLKAKDEISRWLAFKQVVVSDANLPLVCRQMAMRADLSCNIWSGNQRGEPPFLSHAVERLRKLRAIKDKLDGRANPTPTTGNFIDFC